MTHTINFSELTPEAQDKVLDNNDALGFDLHLYNMITHKVISTDHDALYPSEYQDNPRWVVVINLPTH